MASSPYRAGERASASVAVAPVSSAAAESRLIGSILHEEAEDGQEQESLHPLRAAQHPAAVAPSIQRSTSAPPQLAALDGSEAAFIAHLRAQQGGGGVGGVAPSAAPQGGLSSGAQAPAHSNGRSVPGGRGDVGGESVGGERGGEGGDDGEATVVINGETVSANDPRLSPEYYAYYYLQRPLDPRLPPPLVNWSSWHYAPPTLQDTAAARSQRTDALQLHSQLSPRQKLALDQPSAEQKVDSSRTRVDSARRSPQPYNGSGAPAPPPSSFFPPSSQPRSTPTYNGGLLSSASNSTSSSAAAQSSTFLSTSPPSHFAASSFPSQSSFLQQNPSAYLTISPTSSPLTEPLDSFDLQRSFQAISLANDTLESPPGYQQNTDTAAAFGTHLSGHIRGGGAGAGAGASSASPMLAVMGFGALNGSGGANGGATSAAALPSYGQVKGASARPYASATSSINGHSGGAAHQRPHERGSGVPAAAAVAGPMYMPRPSPASHIDVSFSALHLPMGSPLHPFNSMVQLNLAMGGGMPPAVPSQDLRYFAPAPPRRGSGSQWEGHPGGVSSLGLHSADVGGDGRPRTSFDRATHHPRHLPHRQSQRGYAGGELYDDRPSPLLSYSSSPALSPSLLALNSKLSSPAFPPPSSSPHSAWLDDFRLNKTNSHLTLFDVVARGLVLDLSCDQFGSRFIQQRLETATADEKAAAFSQLLDDVIRLSEDVFGNYVVQKFLDHGTAEHRRSIAVALLGHVHALSLQMYGCRVVQKALDVVDPDMQALMVKELNGHVMQLVRDSNGNHVIQKCIERCSSTPYVIHFIVDAFTHQIASLSTHPYGCRVIQRLLEHCSDPQRQSILSELMTAIDELCRNSYGNYVIQHVLIHGSAQHRSAIVQAIRGKLLTLSKHKFASNVVEKCFAHASKADRDALVDEVIGKEGAAHGDSSNAVLIAMVKDQFGNYVIQRLIDVLDDEQKVNLVHRIKRFVPSLKKIPYGKHILAKIDKLETQIQQQLQLQHQHPYQQQQQQQQQHLQHMQPLHYAHHASPHS